MDCLLTTTFLYETDRLCIEIIKFRNLLKLTGLNETTASGRISRVTSIIEEYRE